MTNAGAEIKTLGSGWIITIHISIPSIHIGGSSKKLGQIHMNCGSGITEVVSFNRYPIILRTDKKSLIYREDLRSREHEKVFTSSQLQDNGAHLNDFPRNYGAVQCLTIDDEEKDVIISLYYRK